MAFVLSRGWGRGRHGEQQRRENTMWRRRGKCPCSEKGTKEQGPLAGKETKTAKMVRGPSTRWHELKTASGDRPENRRGGTGSSQRIRGERLPVRPWADAWRGFLSHFPKPKSGSRQKQQALSRIWFSCSFSTASIYSRAWYAANAQNTVVEWKAIHVEKKRKLAALRNTMCLTCVLVASVVSNSFPPCELQPARLLCPWDSPGKNTGVGCHSLLQGIFPAQGLNPGSPELHADSLASDPWGKSMCLMASITFLIFLYLAVPGLSCGTQDHQSSLRHVGSSGCVWTLSCSMQDLVLWPGIKPGPPVLGVQSLSHWTTGERPKTFIIEVWVGRDDAQEMGSAYSMPEWCSPWGRFDSALARPSRTQERQAVLKSQVTDEQGSCRGCLCLKDSVPNISSMFGCLNVSLSRISPLGAISIEFSTKYN